MEEFRNSPPAFFSLRMRDRILDQIDIARNSIETGNAAHFSDNLQVTEHWRLFKEFRHLTAYVDIETTGLSAPGDIITTIALYDGNQIRTYVKGKNLNQFPDDISRYKVIVTYNGKTFDVPFIERYFGIKMDQAHLDLRYILHSLGYSGGLKSCEKQLGIGRKGALADVDGFFAVLLWNEYVKSGNTRVLETQLSYNIEDAVNLEYLLIEAYNRKLNVIPLDLPKIEKTKSPENPYEVHEDVVRRLKNDYHSSAMWTFRWN